MSPENWLFEQWKMHMDAAREHSQRVVELLKTHNSGRDNCWDEIQREADAESSEDRKARLVDAFARDLIGVSLWDDRRAYYLTWTEDENGQICHYIRTMFAYSYNDARKLCSDEKKERAYCGAPKMWYAKVSRQLPFDHATRKRGEIHYQ